MGDDSKEDWFDLAGLKEVEVWLRKLPDTDRKIQMAKRLHADPQNSISDICKTLGISRATLYRYLSLSKSTNASNG